ncbi:MAG: hypothetical protein WCC90_15685 [Methylocella sp.]
MTLTATNPARWQAAGLGECSLRQGDNNPERGPKDRGTQETIAARKREFAIGIDIGAAGALALLTPSGDLLEVADMPTLRDGPKNRATVNSRLLAEIVDRWRATEAFVEHVSARPGEGPAVAFAFGSSRGVIEGVLAACGVPAMFVTPQSWKRVVGLTLRSKDASRAEAIRRSPGHAALFARVKDDGRAEDALIAVAMRRNFIPALLGKSGR